MISSYKYDYIPCDFNLVCKNGARIPVHRELIETNWPKFKELAKNSTREYYMPFPEAWMEIVVMFLYGALEIGMGCTSARGVCTIAAVFEIPELLDLAVMMVGEMLKVHQAQGHTVPQECFERENIIQMCINDVRNGFRCPQC